MAAALLSVQMRGTTLLQACKDGNSDLVAAFLNNRADPNMRDESEV
jgi:hypothetical protein